MIPRFNMRRLRKALALSQASGQAVVSPGRPSIVLGMGETTDQELIPFRLESFWGTGWKKGTSNWAESIEFLSVPKLHFGAHRGLVDVADPQAHTVYGIPGDPNNWLDLYGFKFRPGMTVDEFGEAYSAIWRTSKWLPIPSSVSPLRFPSSSVIARVGGGSWYPLAYVELAGRTLERIKQEKIENLDRVYGPRLVAQSTSAVGPDPDWRDHTLRVW